MSNMVYKLKQMDIYCLKFVNLKLKCRPLDWMMTLFTYFGSCTFSVGLLMVLFSIPRYYHLGVRMLQTLCISNAIVLFIKCWTKRIRPFQKFDFLHVKVIGVDKLSSFPSGHTNMAFSIMMTFMLFLKVHFVFMVIPIIVGLSRVYLGVHYPSDTVIGMLIGTFSSIIVYFL